MAADHGYELLHASSGRRIERFGARIVDRPLPGGDTRRVAAEKSPKGRVDLHFDHRGGWSGPAAAEPAWIIELDGPLRLELRPTATGQVGLFPEHLAMLPWLHAQTPTAVLHGFAYTGLATLALALDGVAVTHLDGSRPTVGWARANATRSGLESAAIRWIVDDVRAYVRREARRGARYEGLILDPPSYGHGPSATAWSMAELPDLLVACRSILTDDAFVLLTAHTPGYGPDRLRELLVAGLGRRPAVVEVGELEVRSREGQALVLGAFARIPRGA